MAGKKKPGALERAILGEIDGVEDDVIADVLAEFGVKQTCDLPPQIAGKSVRPQSSQMGKKKAGITRRPPTS